MSKHKEITELKRLEYNQKTCMEKIQGVVLRLCVSLGHKPREKTDKEKEEIRTRKSMARKELEALG